MAIAHETATRNALASAFAAQVDAGTTYAGGRIIFMAGLSVAATLVMASPAFGAPSSGIITANAITPDSNAAGGTVNSFRIEDRDGVEVVNGSVSVTGGGGDITLSSTSIGAGDTVSITSFTYEASA